MTCNSLCGYNGILMIGGHTKWDGIRWRAPFYQDLYGLTFLVNWLFGLSSARAQSYHLLSSLLQELQQHDVQELNRILFCAIESSLLGTSGERLIATLYHGTSVQQVRGVKGYWWHYCRGQRSLLTLLSLLQWRSSKCFGLTGWVSKSNFTDDIAGGQRS